MTRERMLRIAYPLLSVLLVAPWLAGIYWPAGGGLDVAGYQIGRDFINVWAAPQLAFGGKIHTLFDFDIYARELGALIGLPISFHYWSYPLHVLPLFWPFAQLSYPAALALWTFGLFALFAGVVLTQVESRYRAYAVLALALAPACLINAVGGQNGFLTAALFLGGILALDRRPVMAGVLFGLLTFKPHLGIVLPFVLLVIGAWRTLASAAATAAVLLALSAALFGIEPWMKYFSVTGPLTAVGMQGFKGFYTLMMASVLAGGQVFKLPYSASVALQIGVALPVIAAASWAVRRTADPHKRAFVLSCAAPLITPYAFNYDLTALAAVIVWRLCAPLPVDLGRNAVLLLAWLAPVLIMYLVWVGLGVTPLLLIAAFVLSVHEAAADRPAHMGGRAAQPYRSMIRPQPVA
jgi:alpha-1,2-mannosyltransferase